MTQKVKDSMLHAPSGASGRVLAVDQDGSVSAKVIAGIDPTVAQQVDDNTLAISGVYASAVLNTVTQWAAPNWGISPLSVPDATEVKLLDLSPEAGWLADLNTNVSDVFDQLVIASHQTHPHNVIKTVYRGGTTIHDIRLTFSLTAGNSQFYRIEVRRGGDDSVVIRQVVQRNPDEAEQTVTLKTFTYKADDPYVTDGFYIALVNDSGQTATLDGAFSLTVFSSYQYLSPIV